MTQVDPFKAEGTEARWGKPYIWPTWLTGLIAGEKNCWWAAWFRAHYKYQKLDDPSGTDLSRWRADHATMVTTIATELRRDGYRVSVEDQNDLRITGDKAILGGKPDVIAVFGDGDHARIVDAKTGRQRDSDFWQVLIYMMLTTLQGGRLHGLQVTGTVRYKDGFLVPATMADLERSKKDILRVIHSVASPEAPPYTPSVRECKYCDIACCPARVSEAPQPEIHTTEF